MLNKHNLPMTGLKSAAGETKSLTGYYSGSYVQISYDRSTGEVLTNYHCSLGHNSWSDYQNSEIITICNASQPHTMQDIADMIATAVATAATMERHAC